MKLKCGFRRVTASLLAVIMVLTALCMPQNAYIAKAGDHVHHYHWSVNSTVRPNDTLLVYCDTPGCRLACDGENPMEIVFYNYCGVITSAKMFNLEQIESYLGFHITDFTEGLEISEASLADMFRVYAVDENGAKTGDNLWGETITRGEYIVEFLADDIVLVTTYLDFFSTFDMTDFSITRVDQDTYVVGDVEQLRACALYALTFVDRSLDAPEGTPLDLTGFNDRAIEYLNDCQNILGTGWYGDLYEGSNQMFELVPVTIGEEIDFSGLNHDCGIILIYGSFETVRNKFTARSMGYCPEIEIGATGHNVLANAHTHSWKFRKYNGDIYVYCDEEVGKASCLYNGTENGMEIKLTGTTTYYCDDVLIDIDVDPEQKIIMNRYGMEELTIGYFTDAECSIPTDTAEGKGKAASKYGAPTEIGTYYAAVMYNKGTLGAPDYLIGSPKQFRITKHPQEGITVSIDNYSYGTGAVPTPTHTGTLGDSPEVTWYYNTVDSNIGGIPFSGLTNTSLEPGTYYLYLKASETENYDEFISDTFPFVVNKKGLRVKVEVKDKVYDGTNAAELIITPDSRDILEGDSITVSGVVATFDSPSAREYKTVSVSTDNLVLSGKGSSHYSVIWPSETLYASIKKAECRIITSPSVLDKGVIKYKTNVSEEIIDQGEVEGGMFIFKWDDGAWLSPDTHPTTEGLTKGQHKLYYKIHADSNHLDAIDENWYLVFDTVNGSLKVTSEASAGDGIIVKADEERLKEIALDNEAEGKDVEVLIGAQKKDFDTLPDTLQDGFAVEIGKVMPDFGTYLSDNRAQLTVIDLDLLMLEGTTIVMHMEETPNVIRISILTNKTVTGKAVMFVRNHNGIKELFTEVEPLIDETDAQDGTYYLKKHIDGKTEFVIFTNKFSEYAFCVLDGGRTVNFESNCEEKYSHILVANGDCITNLPTPTKSGALFEGWYTDDAFKNKFTTTTPVTTDITLYAKWVASQAGIFTNDSGITILEPEKKILTKPGEILELKAVVEPSNASKKEIKWISSDEKVATVKDGIVTAVGEGTVDIIAETFSGKKAIITLTVKFEEEPKEPEYVVTSKIKATNAILLGKKLKATVSENKLTFAFGEVKDADLYEVYVAYTGGKYNKVKEIKAGEKLSLSLSKLSGTALDMSKNFKLYVKAYKLVNGKKVEIGKSITAYVAGSNSKKYTNAKSIKLSSSDNVSIKKGKSTSIKATLVLTDKTKDVLPKSITNSFRFVSSNSKIATVDKNGKIVGKAVGTCYIYVYAPNGCTKKVKVTVK